MFAMIEDSVSRGGLIGKAGDGVVVEATPESWANHSWGQNLSTISLSVQIGSADI